MVDVFCLSDKEYEYLAKGIAVGVGIGVFIGAIFGNIAFTFAAGGVLGVIFSLIYSLFKRFKEKQNIVVIEIISNIYKKSNRNIRFFILPSKRKE